MRITLAFLLVLLLGTSALGQMSSHLREEFSDPEAYGIRVVESTSGLRNALADKNTRVLSYQVFGETPTPEQVDALLEWVRLGNSLWFYDVRQAEMFGMQSYYLLPEQFRNKPEKGVLGGKKRPGVATVAVSYGFHPVQTSVGQVTVFLPELKDPETGKASYGSVEVEGDTIPLLQFALDSPALVALRREGRGLIVYKTLLWNEPLSGDRFQLNLLEFSAGFQVPGPAGQGRVGAPPGPEAEYVVGEPAVPLGEHREPSGKPIFENHGQSSLSEPSDSARKESASWALELRSGEVLYGEWRLERLDFETGTGSLKLPLEDVQCVEFGNTIRLDELTTVRGKTSKGLLLSTPILFRSGKDNEDKFDKENVVRIERLSEGQD